MSPIHTTRMGVSKSIEPYELAIICGAGVSMPLLPSQRALIPELWRRTTRPYEPGLPIPRLLPARAYLARTFQGLTQGEVSFEDVWMLRLLAQSVKSGGKGTREITIVDPSEAVLRRFRLLFPSARPGAPTFEEHIERAWRIGSLMEP